MLRLAIFFFNYSTLGHSSTVFFLIKALKGYFKDKIEIIIIETGIFETKFHPFHKYAKFYFFPIISGSRGDVVDDAKKVSRDKFNFLKQIIDNFKPHIFITEYYPFCQNFAYFAFPHFLKYIKDKFHTKIICSCTYLKWTGDIHNLIQGYYDLVLLHLPKELSYGYRLYLPKKYVEELDATLKKFSKKIFFTGFLTDDKLKPAMSKKSLRNKSGIGDRKLIIVSRGGRREYEEIILFSLLMAKNHRDWFFLISAGKDSFEKYKKIAKKIVNVKIEEFIYPHFEDYLMASDLSINMGGYNTTVRLLRSKQKSVVIPINNTEQLWHAQLLSAFLPCAVIRKEDLNLSLLEDKTRRLLENKSFIKKRIKKDWFNGARESARLIKRLFWV
jgi:predicted glycosyltransferase